MGGMAVIDDSGLPEAERDRARVALNRDPALEHELEAILPALSPHARSAFWRSFVRRAEHCRRPAGAVLEALVEAGGADER
jgi:hypothetical protein